MGMVTPVVLVGKLFLQKLWEWDDSLSPSLLQEWEQIAQMLQQLSRQIPRYICKNIRNPTYQIITFCDASAKIYATAVYQRVIDPEPIQVNLIFSKTQLTLINARKPVRSETKQLTLPRLELLIKATRLSWVYVIQHRRFAEVFNAISRNQKNGLQKQLGLKVDQFSILRCHGRFFVRGC